MRGEWRRRGGGGPLGDPLGVRGRLRRRRRIATAPVASTRFVLIDEEAITGFIKMEFDAGAGANIVI